MREQPRRDGLRVTRGVLTVRCDECPRRRTAPTHSTPYSTLSDALLSWTANHLVNAGYTVVALDVEGHGLSGGLRGYVPDFSAVASDIVALLVQTRVRFPGQAVFLFGTSMGGMSALLAALEVQDSGQKLLSGLVLQCPLVRFARPPPVPLRVLARLIASVLPKLALLPSPAGRGGGPSRVAALMRADKLAYTGRLRIGTAVALDRAAAQLRSRMHELKLPFLVQHGDGDAVVSLAGSVELAAMAGSGDKALMRYAGASHNLLHEASATLVAVRRDYLAWLDERVEMSAMSAML